MAKRVSPLTNTEILAAKPTDKERTLQDGDGLFMLIKPSGVKKWRLRYTHPYTNKRILLGIGEFPSMTLALARTKRAEAKSLLAEQIDPQNHWRKNKIQEATAHLNTFGQVAAAWHEVKKTKVSADHAFDIWRSIEKNLLPQIGKLPIRDLDATMLIQSLETIRARGALETVRRLCQRINEIMTYATNTGIIASNPATGIKSAFESPKEKNLPSIGPKELPKLMRDISYASIKLTTRCLLEWQLHTMVRPSEASGARWSEIDFKNKLWIIPAERMKRKERDHLVPLTDSALAILEMMRDISGHREYIFIGTKDPNQPMNSQSVNMALKRMGYGGTLVAHGLRSLASTTLNEAGHDSDVIEAALAHVDTNTIRRVYNRTDYLERRRKLMDWWSDHITEAATAKSSVSGNVTQLKVIA